MLSVLWDNLYDITLRKGMNNTVFNSLSRDLTSGSSDLWKKSAIFSMGNDKACNKLIKDNDFHQAQEPRFSGVNNSWKGNAHQLQSNLSHLIHVCDNNISSHEEYDELLSTPQLYWNLVVSIVELPFYIINVLMLITRSEVYAMCTRCWILLIYDAECELLHENCNTVWIKKKILRRILDIIIMSWQRVGQVAFGLLYSLSAVFKLFRQGPLVPIHDEMVSLNNPYHLKVGLE